MMSRLAKLRRGMPPKTNGASFPSRTGIAQRIRRTLRTIHGVTLAFLFIVGLGPLLWLAKSAITPTQDTLRTPMALWPHGFDLSYLVTAWTETHIDRYFMNTVWIVVGCWLVQIAVATSAAYALSVLRPRFGNLIMAMVWPLCSFLRSCCGSAVSDGRKCAVCEYQHDRHVLGSMVAGGSERVQHRDHEEVLR